MSSDISQPATLFLKNIITVALGSMGAQVINMLFVPMVTRIFSPEIFGHASSFLASSAVLCSIGALCYPAAIVLPKKNGEALALFRISLKISFFMSLFFLLCFLLKTIITEKFDLIYTIGIFTIVFSMGTNQAFEQLSIRHGLYNTNAKAAIFQSIISGLAKVIIGLIFSSYLVLISIFALSPFIGSIFIFLGLNKKTNYKFLVKKWKKEKLVLIKYREFPLYRAPQAILNSFSLGLPIILLGYKFGSEVAGYYSLATTVLSLPISLVGKSVSDVFYPRFSRIIEDRNFLAAKNLFCLCTFGLTIISLAPLGILLLYGEHLFSFVFGEAWAPAGDLSKWICLHSVAMLISRPALAALPVLKLQKLFLVYEVFSFLIRSIGLLIGCYIFESYKLAGFLFGVASFLIYFFIILFCLTFIAKLSYKITFVK